MVAPLVMTITLFQSCNYFSSIEGTVLSYHFKQWLHQVPMGGKYLAKLWVVFELLTNVVDDALVGVLAIN